MPVIMPEGIEVLAHEAVPKGMAIVMPRVPIELFMLPQDDVERWLEEHRGEFCVIINDSA